MISIQEASNIALDYFNNLYAGDVGQLLLEEVEYSDLRDYVYITFSYVARKTKVTFVSELKKQYKQFKIDSKSGEVISMKIRKI